MCIKISDWIHRVSRSHVVLSTLVIFLLFTALVLPGQSASMRMDAHDAGSPDLSFYYTAGDLYQMAKAYGETGRDAYVRMRFTFDVIWPLVYTIFLTTAISWVCRKAFAPGSLWQRANLVPIWGALLDYLENISTSLVMMRYPSHTPGVDVLAPAFTMAKWILVGGSIVLLLAGAGVRVWRWARARGKP